MRYLSFQIGDKEFGIPLEEVREVISFPDITSVPDSPKHILGMMSLRNEILPILDMRICLKVEPTLTHETSVIICCPSQFKFGIVVDVINSVIATEPNELLPVPFTGVESSKSEILKNIVSRQGRLALIIDGEKIFRATPAALASLSQTSTALPRAA